MRSNAANVGSAAELAEHVDKVLKTDGFFQRRCEDVRKARRTGHAEYFESVLEAEKYAETIEEWCPTLIPGLLQTEPYTRAVVRATHPLALDEEVEVKVSARTARADLFEGDRKTPEYWVILPEYVWRCPVIPAAEMADQLDRIADLARRRRIVPQVLPWNCGPHPHDGGLGQDHDLCGRSAACLPGIAVQRRHDRRSGPREEIPQGIRSAQGRRTRSRGALTMIEAAAEDYRSDKQPD